MLFRSLDIQSGVPTLNHLTVTSGTTSVLVGPTIVSGDLTCPGTLSIATAVGLTVKGEFNCSGSLTFGGGTGTLRLEGSAVTFPTDANFAEDNGTVIFAGTSDQTMPALTYHNVQVDKSTATDKIVIIPDTATLKVVNVVNAPIVVGVVEDTGPNPDTHEDSPRVTNNGAPTAGSHRFEIDTSTTVSIDGGAPVAFTANPVINTDIGGSGFDVIFAAGVAAGDTADIIVSASIAGKDNWLDLNNQDNNNGGADTLLIEGKGNGNDRKRGLLKFDLASLPVGSLSTSASITDAYVVLRQVAHGGTTQVDNIYLFQVNQDWAEGTKTAAASAAGESDWVDRFEGTGTWATAGCLATPTDLAATAVATTAHDDELGAYKWGSGVAGMTTLVQGWLRGTTPNYGFCIVHDPNNSGNSAWSATYASGDRAAANLSQRPKLVVAYSVAGADVTVTTAGNVFIDNQLRVITGTL